METRKTFWVTGFIINDGDDLQEILCNSACPLGSPVITAEFVMPTSYPSLIMAHSRYDDNIKHASLPFVVGNRTVSCKFSLNKYQYGSFRYVTFSSAFRCHLSREASSTTANLIINDMNRNVSQSYWRNFDLKLSLNRHLYKTDTCCWSLPFFFF